MYFIPKIRNKHKWHRYAKVKETVVTDKKLSLVCNTNKRYNCYMVYIVENGKGYINEKTKCCCNDIGRLCGYYDI